MLDLNPFILLIINVNGQNTLIKRQRLSDWILKNKTIAH